MPALGLALGLAFRRPSEETPIEFIPVLTPPLYAPLDSWRTSLRAAYSVARRLNRNYTGPLFTVRRTSDNATMDVTWDSSEWADEAALLTFLNGASGYVTVIYDQSVTNPCHQRQTDPAAQMRIVNNGVPEKLDGRLCIYSDNPTGNTQGYIGDIFSGSISTTKLSSFIKFARGNVSTNDDYTGHLMGFTSGTSAVVGTGISSRFATCSVRINPFGTIGYTKGSFILGIPAWDSDYSSKLHSTIADATSPSSRITVRNEFGTSFGPHSSTLSINRVMLGTISTNTSTGRSMPYDYRISEAVLWTQASGAGNSDQTLNEPAIRGDLSYTAGFNFQIQTTLVPRPISGSSSVVTVQDSNYDRFTPATVLSDYQLTPFYSDSESVASEIVWASSDVTKATVDQDGFVTFVGVGAVNITATTDLLTKTVRLTMTSTGGSTADIWSSYVSGSLGKYSIDWVSAAILGKTPDSTTLPLFSTMDHATPNYVRNTNLWASALDWTGVNVWDSTGGNKHATLISPRHVLMATHWPVAQGASIRFIDTSNNIITRTVTAVVGAGTDISIGLLNADVPVGIKFYKILPSTWPTKLKRLQGFPLISSDQEKKALLTNLSSMSQTAGSYVTWPGTPAVAWGETLIGGDSGSPMFAVVSGELVLMSAAHYSTSGPFTTANMSNINSAMTALGGGYQLTEIDLSAYNTY